MYNIYWICYFIFYKSFLIKKNCGDIFNIIQEASLMSNMQSFQIKNQQLESSFIQISQKHIILLYL